MLGSSLIHISPTECGVSECDHEDSIMRRPWPTRGCCAMGGIRGYFKIGTTDMGLKNAMLVVGVE